MKEKRFQVAAVIVIYLLAAAALSSPGRATIRRAFSTITGSQPEASVSNGAEPAAMAQVGEDLESRARARHGWNVGVINSVMSGTITFYDRDGTTTGQANLTVYRKYPDRLRVELNRGGSVEVWGFDQTDAWRTSNRSLGEREARDVRSWLRLCPERLFTTRGGGASYREAGQRREDFQAGRPWQGQVRSNPPLQLQQVEMEDTIGLPPSPTRTGDRRLVTYYINRQEFTIESARWLEPDDPNRRTEDISAAKTDVRVDFSDWRRVGGVLWPFDIVHWQGGKVDFRISITQMQINQSLVDTIFQNPGSQ
jgi:hypothetical protein